MSQGQDVRASLEGDSVDEETADKKGGKMNDMDDASDSMEDEMHRCVLKQSQCFEPCSQSIATVDA